MFHNLYVEGNIKDPEIMQLLNATLPYTFSNNFILVRQAILLALDVSLVELKSKSRRQELVDKRYIYCFFMYNLTRLTLVNIGDSINRDHSTVLHGRKAVVNMCNTDRIYRDNLKSVIRKVNELLAPETVTAD